MGDDPAKPYNVSVRPFTADHLLQRSARYAEMARDATTVDDRKALEQIAKHYADVAAARKIDEDAAIRR